MKQMTVRLIKKLRQETGAGIVEVKQALEQAKGEEKKAKEILKKQGLAKVEKRADKQANEGQVFSYVHNGGRIGAMVELRCETDFVVRSKAFQLLGKELAMQVASMAPKNIKVLLSQDYIRDPGKKVEELIKETAAKVKENVVVAGISRMEL